jgi:sulfite exporter TauE/SafE
MIWSAVVLGFMGSLHCLAMCGPLVVTLNAKRSQSMADKILYNGGRIFTYCLVGLLAGLFGAGLQWAVGQQFLSVLAGIALLGGLWISWLGSKRKFATGSKIFTRVKMRLSKMLKGKPVNMWWFGVYNGLLPCGLTYVALAASVAAGSVIHSVLYMGLFGLGTSPMMWLIVSGFQRFKTSLIKSNKVVTGFTLLLAILLIVRGLGLGVPYLSPDHNHQHKTHMSVAK